MRIKVIVCVLLMLMFICACVEKKKNQRKHMEKTIDHRNIESSGRNLTGNYCVYLFGGFEMKKKKNRDHKSAHLLRFIVS